VSCHILKFFFVLQNSNFTQFKVEKTHEMPSHLFPCDTKKKKKSDIARCDAMVNYFDCLFEKFNYLFKN
jgi:hypothetical protein